MPPGILLMHYSSSVCDVQSIPRVMLDGNFSSNVFFFVVPNLCPCISTWSDFLHFPESLFLPAFRKHAWACCIAGGESTNDSNSKRQSCCRWEKARATGVCCSLVCWDHWMCLCCLRDESFSLCLNLNRQYEDCKGKISPPLLPQLIF